MGQAFQQAGNELNNAFNPQPGMQPGMQQGMQQYPGGPMMMGQQPGQMMGVSDKQWLTTLLLCFFGGYLGIHRFYTGHTLFGVIQLCTGGGCGFWVLYDLIMILTNKYTDAQGRPLQKT